MFLLRALADLKKIKLIEMLCSKPTMIIRRSREGIKTFVSAPWRNVTLSTSAASHHRLEQQPEGHPNQRHNTPFVIFDTAQNSKCRLTTKKKNILTWYSCGPTVYDSAHIGHASSFIRQDVIRRIIESVDKQLTLIQVMGITDIDDKIIRRANETGGEWKSVSKHFEREFLEDLTNLNVLPPHVFSRVSDFIPEIIRFVGKLVESKVAYEVADGSVYFDTERYGEKYGIFRQNTENVTVEDTTSSDGKRNSRDFALWKGAKPGEPFWSSPWGTSKQGRPGWHIECSVMASHFFGPSLDLHTGGRDLIFPHHENEEAQCCAHFQSDQWTSHWLHMGHLHFKGASEKMSKSLGNTISIRDFLKDHSPDLLRLLCINAKYRKNLDYSPDSLEIARKIAKKLTIFLTDSSAILNGTKQVVLASPSGESSLWEDLESAKGALNNALLDDFDTPEALKIVTELISNFNRNYSIITSGISSSDVNSSVNFELVFAIRIFVQEFVNLVGLSLETNYNSCISGGGTVPVDSRLENVINQFVQFRNQVRSYSLAMEETDKERRRNLISERKDLLQACDKVRDEMLEENKVEIKDHGKNSTWMFTQ